MILEPDRPNLSKANEKMLEEIMAIDNLAYIFPIKFSSRDF